MIPAASLKSACLWKYFPNSGQEGEPSGLFSSLVVLLGVTAPTGQVSSRAGMPVPCPVLPHQLLDALENTRSRDPEPAGITARVCEPCGVLRAGRVRARLPSPCPCPAGSARAPRSPRASAAPAEQMVPIFAGGGGGNKARSAARLQPGSQTRHGAVTSVGTWCPWRAEPRAQQALAPALPHLSPSFVGFSPPFQIKKPAHRRRGCR